MLYTCMYVYVYKEHIILKSWKKELWIDEQDDPNDKHKNDK